MVRARGKGPAIMAGKRFQGRLDLMLEDVQEQRAPWPHCCCWPLWSWSGAIGLHEANPLPRIRSSPGAAVQHRADPGAGSTQALPLPLVSLGPIFHHHQLHTGSWCHWSLPCSCLHLWGDLYEAVSPATSTSTGIHGHVITLSSLQPCGNYCKMTI